MEFMSDTSYFRIADVIQEIRGQMNTYAGELTDDMAMEIIEQYVFSHAASPGRNIHEMDTMVRRIFLSLRREMDILQPYVEDDTGFSTVE